MALAARGTTVRDVLTDAAVRNAMVVHAAFGGSTNLLLHVPGDRGTRRGLAVPTVDDWAAASRAAPRLVDALPNGPRNHPTVQVFLAGGVPEVMLHLRDLGLLDLGVATVTGESLGENLDWWEGSVRRQQARAKVVDRDGVDPDHVIHSPASARRAGMTGTLVFPMGNLAPQGSVIKSHGDRSVRASTPTGS